MEWLIAIGTGFVGKLAEYTVEPVIRQVGYVICYNRNLKRLEKKVGDLGDARQRVQHAVETEERSNKKIENDVQNWLTEVDEITEEANSLLKDERHTGIKCLYGLCPNLKLRHQLSRKSTKLVQDVIELHEKKDFSSFAYKVKPQEVCSLSTQDYEAFDSRTSTVKQIIDQLRDSNTYMIGLYGMGGVGKTTLVKEVYRQVAADGNLFEEVVIILDLKKNPSIERIQKEAAEQLGLELSENETPAAKARHLCNRIKDKKTLVILDDVWENIDLEAVGLPRMATLKILLTSRSKIVLSKDMGTQKEFPLDLLDREEAWSLFQNMAGDTVKKSDIRRVATQVAEKCGGLPILIVTIANGLRKSPLHVWKDTLRRLKRLDGQELTDKAYSALEWSYNRLANEELKSLFLLCVFIPWYYSKVDLWKYSMGLGLLKHVITMGEAWDAFNSLLETLRDSSLLLEIDDTVKMHDLVQDVAKRITSREQHVISLAPGSELKEWPDEDFCKKCTMISFPECSLPKLPEVLGCQELLMFHLHSATDDSSLAIPCNFFQEMRKLRVLDLTNLSIASLPSSLIFLKTLRTLCLDQCTLEDISLVGQLKNLESLSFLQSKFRKLPKEIAELTSLRLLDLTGCSQLEVISPNVLSSMERLEHLRMGNSFNRWEAGGVTSTERSNANLEELTHLHQLTVLQIHIPDANKIPAGLFSGKLERYQICIGAAWKWSDVDENLNALKLQLSTSKELDHGLKMLLKSTEDLYLDGMEGIDNSIIHQLGADVFQQVKRLHVQNTAGFAYIINGKGNFPNLTWLAVTQLNSSRFLLSSSMARCLTNLRRLQISGCQIMEEIILMDEEVAENMFCQLQDLELKDLPNLTKFRATCYTELANPSSERLQLENVQFPNLKKLSIDGLAKLTSIWSNQFSLDSSKSLESVEIVSCENLKSIFPDTVASSLQQLRRLRVRNCGVEEIVSNTDGTQTAPVFDFPKLTYVEFNNLPQLRSFYPGSHTSNWPSLITLAVYDCDNVRIFKEGKHEVNNLYTPNKESLFSFEKDSFPNLESLGLDIVQNWDNPPLHSFRKLKELIVYAHSNSSIDSLEKLLGVSTGEIHTHTIGSGTLPHLRELWLIGMRKLMHLGEDSNRPAIAHVPNLEILVLKECDSLKNLRSSAISFKTLTTLQVSVCKGLKYLITYSIARSLEQLRKLEVEDCEEMIEILASSTEEHDSINEIEFKQLKTLKLFALPKLRGFCSGTHIVRFPSLESLSISCPQLETFIFHPKGQGCTIGKEIEQADSNENFETKESKSLFDKKVEFPSLRSLSINGAKNLITIWNHQLGPDSSFRRLTNVEVHGCGSLINIFESSVMRRMNSLETISVKECKSLQVVFELGVINDLKEIPNTSAVDQLKPLLCQNLHSIEIDSCESLKYIFPVSVAMSLHELKVLTVRKCGVKEIIAKGEGQQSSTPNFVFPKVTHVSFVDLPQLRSFYPDVHVSSWPTLQELEVTGCHKVENASEGNSSLQGQHELDQALFSSDKDSFFNLKHLTLCRMEIWNGPFPLQIFRKLISLTVCCPQSKSGIFLEKLLLEGNYMGQEIRTLPHLRKLGIREMQNLLHLGEENSQSTCPRIPNLEFLELYACHSLRNLRSFTISFNNLTTLQVSVCKGFKYLLTHSIAKCLVQLTNLEVEDCGEIIEIVESSTEEHDSRNEIEFKKLKHLKLSTLPRLRGFCSGTRTVRFPSLESLSVSCPQLEAFIFDPTGECSTTGKETEQSVSKENIEIVESYFIFDKKVELPSLKSLSISGAAKLTTVWHSQLAADSFYKLSSVQIHECESLISIFGHSMMGRLNALESLEITKCPSVQVVFDPYGGIGSRDTSAGQINLFECQNLQSVIIDSCESLKTIFPTSVARNLQRLKTLRVKKCGVEEIVANEEGLQKLPTFVFPKVTLAEFGELPKLKCFYSGMHVSIWPSLVVLGVYGCDKVDVLAEESSSLDGNHEPNCSYSPTKQTLLLIEKDSSFPNLVWLWIGGMEIWNGPLPVKLFGKLKYLVVRETKSKSIIFFDKLQVDLEAASSSCAVGVGTHGQLPHLKHLRLIGMDELMHLGQDDSQPARPNFPYLEILHVNSCHSLRNLRSSAISFENLTTLHVSYCIGLKYLLTHSQAKSLTQLINLEVESCFTLVRIVGSINEDDDDSRDDITFRRLKILKLSELPRLQGFCLGNRTVKFPSLETLSISNRLKLKIFSHEEMLQTTTEEEDTDVEECETWLAEHDVTSAELTAAY